MPGGFPHSEIAGSKVVCHLPNAYRRLPRLSSPLTAKASTVCAYSLDHITPNNPMDCQSPGLHDVNDNPELALEITSYLGHGPCSETRLMPVLLLSLSTFLKSDLIRDQTSGIRPNDSCMNSVAKRKLVEPSGIEPLTSCVQGRRSPS